MKGLQSAQNSDNSHSFYWLLLMSIWRERNNNALLSSNYHQFFSECLFFSRPFFSKIDVGERFPNEHIFFSLLYLDALGTNICPTHFHWQTKVHFFFTFRGENCKKCALVATAKGIIICTLFCMLFNVYLFKHVRFFSECKKQGIL